MKRKLDSIGRPQLARRTTPVELARRRDIAAEMYDVGYTLITIGKALDVDPATIGRDLASRGITPRRGRPERQDEPPATPWRDEDMTKEESPHYLNSLAVSMVKNATEYFTRQDAINLLSFDTHDALRAGDEAWISNARATLSRMTSYIGRMQAVLDSDEARLRGMGTREQVERPDLRVVR